jgi:hypothetical protein
LEFRDSTHNDVNKILLVDKLKEKDVTGTCSAFAQIPASLGLVESVPKYLEVAEDNEEAAWDLHGLIFHDDDMDWCTVTGWGVDHGTNIIFYTLVGSTDPTTDEEHVSLN